MERLEKLAESYKWIEKIAGKATIEFLKTTDMLEEVHDRFFKEYDLSNTKFNVLVILYKGRKEEIYMSKIGERMLLSNANITGLVDRLEEQAFVKRVRSVKDRRKIAVKITEEGVKCVEKVIEDYKIWSKRLSGTLTTEENKQLVKLLKSLQQGIMQIEREGSISPL